MITIDIKYKEQNPDLLSRLIWQELFDEYRRAGGDLTRMDELLCDLSWLAKQISFGKSHLYWKFNCCGFTEATLTLGPFPSEYYCIEIDYGCSKITIRPPVIQKENKS